MTEEFGFLSALLMGLLGGVHCIGMCGGIVGALSLGAQQAGTPPRLSILLSYNLGRILSYGLAGALFGGISALVAHWGGVHQLQLVLQAVAGLFMLALGLYLANWWRGLARLEAVGSRLWRHIEPLGRRFLPVRHAGQALALGLVWGWLPCGLVYTALAMSITTGRATDGALLMLAFGLGTLPNLLAMGLAADLLRRYVQQPLVRSLAGLLVMGFGIYTLIAVARLF